MNSYIYRNTAGDTISMAAELFLLILLSTIFSCTVASAEVSNSGLTQQTKFVDPQQQLLNEYRLHFNDPEQLQQAGYRFECQGN